MPRYAGCRLFVLVAVLAFMLGPVAHGVQAAGMDAGMASMSTEAMPSPDTCGGCTDDGMAVAACVAMCGAGTIVLPPLAGLLVLSNERLTPPVASLAPGRAGPPDPYPPRSFVLT